MNDHPHERHRDILTTISRVAKFSRAIETRREKSNAAATTGTLAGLVLSQDIIRPLLREEIMQESTF